MTEFRIADPLLRRIAHAVGMMGVIAFGFYTFSLLQNALVVILNVLAPFMAAFLVAYILAPLVIALQQRLRLGRIMGTLALYLIIFLVIFIMLAFLIPTVISQFIQLFNTLKVGLPRLLEQMAQSPYLKIEPEMIDSLQKRIMALQIDYQTVFTNMMPGLKKMASGGFEAIGVATRGIFSGVTTVVGFFTFIVFVGIINFYLIVDWEKILPILRKMTPPEHRERTFNIFQKIDKAVGGFIRGQLTVSAIIGFCFAVSLFCMGFAGFPALRNYCLLIGTAATIGGFIPYLGSVIGVTPALLIVAFTGGVPWSIKIINIVVILGIFNALQAVEGFILQPRIVGKGAGLHPLAVMFALLFGAQFGIGGMIVAVPLAGVIRVFFMEFYWEPIERREALLAEATGDGEHDSES